MKQRAADLLPLGVLAVALAVLFFPVLTGQTFYWGLPTLQFHPWRLYAVQELAAGTIPWWNPFNGAGAPLLANYQSALLYPPGWLTLVLPVLPTMSFLAVLHLFIAGWGMWMFAGRLGVSSLGRALAGLAFGLTQYTVARLGTYPTVTAVAWTGWILWAADAVITTSSLRHWSVLALLTALLLLAGHAQSAWYILLLTAAFIIWRILVERAVSALRLIYVGSAVLLGAGMAAVQLAATGEFLLVSQREDGVAFDFAMNFSYAPLRSLNLIAPNLFGTPADGSYVTAGAYFEDAVYVGLIPLISAAAALFGLRRAFRPSIPRTRHATGFWTLVLIVGFVFALGQNTPIFPFLYRNVPTFNVFQAPVRWHLWTVVALSVLSAIGAEHWTKTPKIRRWSRRGLAIGSAIALAGLALSLTGTGAVATLGRGLIAPALVLAAACVLSLTSPLGCDLVRQRRWLLAVCCVTAADLVVASWGLNPTTEADLFQPRSTVITTERRYLSADWVESETYDRFFQFDDYRAVASDLEALRASGLPNINLFDRQPLLNQFDPLLIDHYARYLELIETAADDDVHAALLAGAGVGQHPRAWMVAAACWHASDAGVSEVLMATSFDPDRLVHLRGSGACSAASEPIPAVIALTGEDADSLTLTVETPRGGWLVLADTFYPGWRAFLDGVQTSVERANGAFRAISIAEGRHTVEFLYQPGWAAPVLMIAVSGWLVWILIAVTALTRRTTAQPKSHRSPELVSTLE